jgi:hypothetical protein
MQYFVVISTLFLGILMVGCGSSGSGGDEDDSFIINGAVGARNKPSLIEFESPAGLGKISAVSAACPTCTGSPTSFTMTLYQAWISANTDCSSPVLIEDHGAAGTVVNLSTSPTLFSGTPAAGSYPCLIIVASDNLKFTVNPTAVAAHVGCIDTTTINTHDTYRDGEPDDGAWIDLDGNPIDATGSRAAPGADKVTTFATTDTASVVAGIGSTPAHMNQVLLLTSPLVVPGSVTLRQNWTDGIDNENDAGIDYCTLEDGSMGFL